MLVVDAEGSPSLSDECLSVTEEDSEAGLI